MTVQNSNLNYLLIIVFAIAAISYLASLTMKPADSQTNMENTVNPIAPHHNGTD
jgi:hypothetical protein